MLLHIGCCLFAGCCYCERLVRLPVPERILKLKAMIVLGFGSGQPALARSCAYCDDTTARAAASLRTCPVCMLTVHPDCVRAYFSDSVDRFQRDAHLPELIEWMCFACCAALKTS